VIVKFLKLPFIRLFVIPCILFLIFVLGYGSYQKKLPVSYWDEIGWVGRSYFFEFFIHRDFSNRIWKSTEAYDQPKLTEYAYGVWLYPTYLIDKSQTLKSYDYTQFLIKNGFYEIDESYMNTYSNYKDNFSIIRFDDRMSGFPEEWVAKYGRESLRPIDLIIRARTLNIFILAGAVVLGYFLALKYGGLLFASIFSIFYGSNTLIMDTALRAHSEALFLFTINAAMLFMSLYFIKRRRLPYLLLFSLSAGLSMSTKLNGIMFPIIFFIVNIIFIILFKKRKAKYFFIGLLAIIICLVIFILLNPFTYADPIKNVQFMFDYRMKTAIGQSKYFSEALIPRGITVIEKIFRNFYFSDQEKYYNGIEILKQLTVLKSYGIYLFILFSFGIISLLKQIHKLNTIAIIIFCSFVIILGFMSYYLILDWGRYFAPLTLFFTMFQSLGLFFVLQYIYKHLKLLAKRLVNRA
jgi:hypothetical protein